MDDDESPREIDSAFASPTFEKDGSFEVDKPVGSMSISPCGRDVVLASRQGLHIIDLDSPWKPPRHLAHHTPWEVADVQWSPFPARDHWVVSTANQRALVWHLGAPDPRRAVEHYLHAHTRAITDINFSAHHPDVLATCSVDSFVHCWDLRAPRRPAVSFADWFGGATQVRWNRQDEHVVASSHDRFLRVWDRRKGMEPLCSIDAHATKIYGIDWNRTRATAVVTCSLDRTIKFWDYSSSITEPEQVLHTPYPVWRARHTPFGHGLLAMPQRGDNNLHLYNRSSGPEPTETAIFEGHQDQVKEFLWRFRGGIESEIDNREFQLVTWGADRMLRLHRMDDKTLSAVGYGKGQPVDQKFKLTRKDPVYRTFRDPSKLEASDPIHHTMMGPFSFTGPAGMNSKLSSSPSFATGGWFTSGFLNARHGLRAKNQARQDLDPISWMKGVKIGKKEANLEDSTGSLVTPHSRLDKTWEDFDSLGEEITHVGSKFSKVQFHDVDVRNRYVKISMNGLWGSNETSVYLNCRLDFPKLYPNGAAPSLAIEQTAQLDDAAIQRLQAGVKEIGEAYLGFRRSSLEALIRFLQGDQSIGDALAWTRVQETSVIDFGAEAGSSSDEDDLGELGEEQDGDLDPMASGPRILAGANANVPLPKGCGAVWAKDGRLVCFFPPKEDLAASLAGSIGLDRSAIVSKGRAKYFEGFGHVHDYPKLKSKTSSLGTLETSDSETDSSTDSSLSSTSETSSSSRNLSSRETHPTIKHRLHLEFPYLSRLDGLSDDMPASNASASMAISGPKAAKNLISIHDLESLLPAKRILARRYHISGLGACRHNSGVARELGFADVADVWELLDSLLEAVVPLERFEVENNEGASITYRVRDRLRHRDSGIGLSQEFEVGVGMASAHGRVKWSCHPFADKDLVPRLLECYRSTGDVQMLAMMSCVLAAGARDLHNWRGRPALLPGPVLDSSQLGEELPRNDDRVYDYYPSMEVGRSAAQNIAASNSGEGSPLRLPMDPHSQSSSYGAGNSDSSNQAAKSFTPPDLTRQGQRNAVPAEKLISSSPERMRRPQRSSSNLATAFAASLPRPFTFNSSLSSSPPNPGSFKKRISPVGSLGAQTTVREASRSFEKPMELVPASEKNQTILDGARGEMTIRLKNQDQFALDSYGASPLLDPSLESLYEHYRSAYASLLAAWDLPLERAEVLQFNGRSASHPNEASKDSPDTHSDNTEPALAIGKRAPTRPTVLSSHPTPLAIVTHCHACGVAQRGPARTRCPKCRARARGIVCALCAEPVRGLAAPCVTCGHILHPACQTLLQEDREAALDGGTDDGRFCITGCRCRCADAQPAFEEPHRAAVLAPSEATAVSPGRSRRDASSVSGRPNGKAAAAPSLRDDVAYESLAKNLAVGGGGGSFRRGSKGGQEQGSIGKNRGRAGREHA